MTKASSLIQTSLLFLMLTNGTAMAASLEVIYPPGITASAYATAISADGNTVVGTVNIITAFTWDKVNGYRELPGVPGYQYGATGVSEDGRVVIGYMRDPMGNYHAARWVNGAMPEQLDLGYTDSYNSMTTAVSADGSIVVGALDIYAIEKRAFIWREGEGLEELLDARGDIIGGTASAISPDGQWIVGSRYHRDAFYQTIYHGFRWSEEGGAEDLGVYNIPGRGDSCTLTALSEDGTLVAGYSTALVGILYPATLAQDSLWKEGAGMTTSGTTVEGMPAAVYDLTYDGSVGVGGTFASSTASSTAAIWDEASGFRSLTKVLKDEYHLDTGPFNLDMALGISADGQQIVGYGRTLDDTISLPFVIDLSEDARAPTLKRPLRK